MGVTAIHIGVSCCSMYSAVSGGDYRFGLCPLIKIMAYACYNIVFMSPEIAVQPPWRNIFQTPHFKKHLTLVAVDEAHCIPEWLGRY